mgnify:CR=1 FL=1
MMDGHGTFLRIDTRTQFLCGTEKETDAARVHVPEQFLACVVAVRLLDEPYLFLRDIVVFHELAPYFAVDVPLVRLVSAQVREYELCAFLVKIFVVILRNLGRAVGRLVSRTVAVLLVYQPHVKRHLVRVVGGDQHLCLFFRLGQRFPVYVGCIPGFSELYQFLNENLLLGSGRYVIELLVEFRPVNPYVFGRFVIGYLRIKVMGVNVID